MAGLGDLVQRATPSGRDAGYQPHQDKPMGVLRAKLPSIERVRELLDYDPETGVLTWRTNRGRLAKAGDVASWLEAGYLRCKLDGKNYQAHRLIWLHFYGAQPPDYIDHKDMVCTNNRIYNLRAATHSQNKTNGKPYTSNISGHRGVYRSSKSTWAATVNVNERQIYLGSFKTLKEAAECRAAAARRYYGEFARVEDG